MKNSMTSEQYTFYGKYFDTYNSYLRAISGEKPPQIFNDVALMLKFESAILDTHPKSMYKHETWRYKFYYNAIALMPINLLKDCLMKYFLQMPNYTPEIEILENEKDD